MSDGFNLKSDLFPVVERLDEMKQETLDAFFRGELVLIVVFAWWNLLSVPSDTCDNSLESKLKSTRSDVMVEHGIFEEVTFKGKGLFCP